MILWLLQLDDTLAVTVAKNKLGSGLGPKQSIGNNGGAQLWARIGPQSREGRRSAAAAAMAGHSAERIMLDLWCRLCVEQYKV